MLDCIVTVKMARDGVERTYRDGPEAKDWEGFIASKRGDGWKLLDHKREFVERTDREKIKDKVNLK